MVSKTSLMRLEQFLALPETEPEAELVDADARREGLR